MFTGIIQAIGIVKEMKAPLFRVAAPFPAPQMGESVAVDGACLTVTETAPEGPGCVLSFDVSTETLERTTLGDMAAGQRVNIELAARMGAPLGGHFVLGHVDATAKIAKKENRGTWTLYEFTIPMRFHKYIVPKGSVAVDGISLTAVDVHENSFTAAVVPHTEKNTCLGFKNPGELVNLETDIMAKHVERLVRGWQEEPQGDLFQKKVLTWEEILRQQENP